MRSHQGVKLITSLLLLNQNTIGLYKEKEFISVQTFDVVGMRYVKSFSTNPILGIKGVVRYLIKCLILISIFSAQKCKTYTWGKVLHDNSLNWFIMQHFMII